MNITDIITTDEAREGFYPTPPNVVEKLLDGIEWDTVTNVLEPSAGKGNLVDGVASAWREELGHYRSRYNQLPVDCIEIDPYLRSIVQYEYCGQKAEEIRKRLRELEDSREFNRDAYKYEYRSPSDAAEHRELEAEKDKRTAIECRIVHDNFLSFNSRKRYSLIVMNPPFSNGDEHLLHAINLQSRHGGQIRCVLNAETILNPYTNRRKILQAKLEELRADISFIDGAFSDGESKTDVRVAIIKIDIPAPEAGESEIYERLKAAAKVEETAPDEVTDLAVADFLQEIVTRFNVEVDAGLALIREYKAMQPYLLRSLSPDETYNKPLLALRIDGDSEYTELDVNRYLRLTRRKYWKALFTNKDFTGKLTSNLREKYQGMVDKMQDYDFTLFNIQQIMVEMNAEMQKGVEDTIVALFDRMTAQHSWYPECQKNIHYYNGWKTNKAHKINNKVILPVNGMFSSYSWEKDTFCLHTAYSTISDIEKVFEYLDGNMSAPVNLHFALECAQKAGQTRNIHCKFFDVTLYKKGTMHIKFHNQDLVDRFNIYCSRKKNWLPPNYGRTSYAEMDREAQTVVDEFHGNGAEGSGATAYNDIMKRQGYFLAEPGGQVLSLPGA